MFENRRMPNGTSEPSLGLCGVGGRACEGSLYPMCAQQRTCVYVVKVH